MLKLFEVVEAKELLPIVPVFNYTNKPIVPWKKEANRIELSNNGLKNVDYVLTTRELANMIKETGINFDTLQSGIYVLKVQYYRKRHYKDITDDLNH